MKDYLWKSRLSYYEVIITEWLLGTASSWRI